MNIYSYCTSLLSYKFEKIKSDNDIYIIQIYKINTMIIAWPISMGFQSNVGSDEGLLSCSLWDHCIHVYVI